MIRGDFRFSSVPMTSKYYCGKQLRNARFVLVEKNATIRAYHADGRVVFSFP
jgi:hypothetical protein